MRRGARFVRRELNTENLTQSRKEGDKTNRRLTQIYADRGGDLLVAKSSLTFAPLPEIFVV